VDAQNTQIWTASAVIGIEPKSAQIGGSSPKLLGGGTILAALTWTFASSNVMSSGYMSDQRKLPSW
jgi:hypothetical protein